jgi:hypothetical protein
MVEQIKSALSEKDKISTMRIMSLFSLLVGAGIAIYGIYEGKDLGGVAEICGVFVGAAVGGKVTQKYAE